MTISLTPDTGLRDRRKRLRLTQEELARRARVSRSLVQLIERGYEPTPGMARRIDRALARAEETVTS